MAQGRQALVIGGGVVGVSAAYYLARDGFAVTLVEKADIAAGSSYGNCGVIPPSHSVPLAAPGVWLKGLRWMWSPESPFYIKPRLDPALAAWLARFAAACTLPRVRRAMPVLHGLHRASLALYRELAALPGLEFGLTERGAMAVYTTAQGYAEGAHEALLLAEAGIETRLLDAAGARAAEPSLSPGVVGGVLFPGDACLVPDAFVTGLARVAEGLGVRILRATEVLGLRADGRRVTLVETTRGDLAADVVVLAAGAWSPGIARTLGLDLPIQPAKGYSVTCERPEGAPRMPLFLGEARMAVTPMGDRLRIGGTLELAGLDLTIDRRRVEAIMRAAPRYLTCAERPVVLEIWRGLRPCTPDGLPLLGRPRRLDNLVVAAGHAMIGMSLGPVTGRLVAELAADQPLSHDLTLLAPDRWERA